ncbi:hypothetical protein PHYBLDRAFT_62415 [Phycomyces blakesleeanus NRRL 1555(-)]|uniref:Uncharacterized protein n=1 Tax=Phycomyces blakesleeanus (strain ATCC 8743b / DSM 1359 / FGSC 10004 / NBRC 33097 / NRRL 1555) TaxID=763407 RepID=A0A162Y7P4_PHYB8|nr:hypothetical protein PHYBLDRAFT_62415 [Phycomyces blakesleeanus NRRL 1555(-)]OAD78825.1 hypothetical protein PHYBLDRAFT_62415 [Phycomyces blakesleeanus NRRL 1555(-)]|eukprot:XP_018296865.1 hypothetical protein PHYBLDRAFT_62415 [Phycomyces blakesleeanus NRRL 1555(-)]
MSFRVYRCACVIPINKKTKPILTHRAVPTPKGEMKTIIAFLFLLLMAALWRWNNCRLRHLTSRLVNLNIDSLDLALIILYNIQDSWLKLYDICFKKNAAILVIDDIVQVYFRTELQNGLESRKMFTASRK